ncbi:MAG TPA: glutathione S-transferase [Rhizobacter sp.]|nr:glutathione S-transferase [Rhizobacter sp.]
MHVLFGSSGSGSAAIEAALERTKAPYRIVNAATWEPTSALTELRAVNPLQQIPTLALPDGSVLTESAAILIHLGLAFPKAALLPDDESRRAQAIRGLVYIAANCYAAIGVNDYPERWCADIDDSARERIVRGTRARLHHYWDVFAEQFQVQLMQEGDQPAALDMLAAVVSKWSGSRAHLKAAKPAFYAALQRIEAHPDIAPIFARHFNR